MVKSEGLISKIQDPKLYLEKLCKIKGKTPGLVPFILNEAQKDLFNTLRKASRTIILKARQIGFCLLPNTKVLTSSLEWIKLDDIRVGQEIISVQEIPERRGCARKILRATVQAKWDVYEDAIKLTMDDGRELVATPHHRFLGKKWESGTETMWKEVKDMKQGDTIRSISSTWEVPDYEDGWFGGIIDGEGSLSKPSRTGISLTVSQVSGDVWERMNRYATNNKYSFRIEVDRRTPGNSSKFGAKEVNKLVFSKVDEVFMLLGKTRPARFINRDWWNEKQIPNNGWNKIVKIESVGKQRMIDLQTSEKTFIAEGFISHNSTAVTGFFYHKTITTPGTNTALIGYNSDLTAELLDKVKTFWQSTPANLRPTIRYNSKYEISFPSIDSKIIVLPSTENVGRGYTLHNVLATELSAWEKAEEKMMTLEASVPIGGKIVIESTPRGRGNLYHRMWTSDNDYVKKEYGWWWLYTREEIEIIKRRMNNPMKFAQEYGLEFLASGRLVFDGEATEAQRVNVLEIGHIVDLPGGGSWVVKKENDLTIYKPPVPGRSYVFGVDVSEGIDGGDYSVAVCWDRTNGEEVAFYRGLIAPDKFSVALNTWGRKFNNALMVVEINNHGLTTVTGLKQLLYPSMYFRPSKFETMGTRWSDRLGWKTTKVTRPLLIDDFAQAVREQSLTIHSQAILSEMDVFVYDSSNNMVPQEGFHDDCIFACGIGFQGFKVLYDKELTQINYEHHMPASGY